MLILLYVLVIIKHLKFLTYHIILSRSEISDFTFKKYNQRYIILKLQGAGCGMPRLLLFLTLPDRDYVPATRPA